MVVVIANLVQTSATESHRRKKGTQTGVKTTGLWILKRGGVLDVIGGFLFVVVGCYYYALFIAWVLKFV